MTTIDSEMLVALCSCFGTALGTFGGIRLMSYRIEQLEKQVERLSDVVDRTYRLEQRAELVSERLNSANERIGRLEGRLGIGNTNTSRNEIADDGRPRQTDPC
ncbi:MAG: hypothetical protein K6B74_02950 [Ruminococcus sp.]|nr:hypothetical protein [Ruminococcus sp.]